MWTIRREGGEVWLFYGRANLWRDWGGNAVTTFSGTDGVPLHQAATRLELAAGVTARVHPNLSFYAQAGYQFAIGDTDGGRRQGIKGDIGLRYVW